MKRHPIELSGRRKRATGYERVIDSEHTYLFDQELGALISRTSKAQITGKLTVDVDNQSFNGTFTHTLEEKATRQK